MQCPIDGAKLVLAERSGVEIDYCPECRGVWLDRGELDKIIDRAAPETNAPQRVDEHRGQYGGQHGNPRKKRGGFLGELFDF